MDDRFPLDFFYTARDGTAMSNDIDIPLDTAHCRRLI